jgi:NAD(P)-dependent dehydrogenase (short-subunit alcohol dehydrogenase family)
MPNAVITGASRGLGLAVTRALASRGWDVIVDARDQSALRSAMDGLGDRVTAIPGDVTDVAHRTEIAEAVRRWGHLDLLVNNASTLGPSPRPALVRFPIDELRRVFEVNVFAPLALSQELAADLSAAEGTIVNVTSDAGSEPYEGWGGYGSSKAALDQLTLILGAEHPASHVYVFDPGDMRTVMHQEAFPGEDISDRPEPETVVPSFLRLIDERPPSGRYAAGELTEVVQEVGA